MRTSLFVSFAAVLTGFLPHAAASEDIVLGNALQKRATGLQNPSFESGSLQPWITASNQISSSLKRSDYLSGAHNGQRYLLAAARYGGSFSYSLEQRNINIAAGSRVRVNVWVRTFSPIRDARVRVYLDGRLLADKRLVGARSWTQVGTGNTGTGVLVAGNVHRLVIQVSGSNRYASRTAFAIDDAQIIIVRSAPATSVRSTPATPSSSSRAVSSISATASAVLQTTTSLSSTAASSSSSVSSAGPSSSPASITIVTSSSSSSTTSISSTTAIIGAPTSAATPASSAIVGTPTSLAVSSSTATIPSSTPSHAPGTAAQCLFSGPDYISAALFHHNQARANHNAAPLTWSTTAASHALVVANRCIFEHYSEAGWNEGQNLYATSGACPNITAGITEAWYKSEFPAMSTEYGKPTPANFDAVGHLTQVLWKGTTQVGCASVDCTGRMIVGGQLSGINKYTVCDYLPAGNFIGEFDVNVGRPISNTNLGHWYD